MRSLILVMPLLFACEPAPVGPATSVPATPLAEATERTPVVPAPSAQAQAEYEQNTIDVYRAVSPATVYVTQTQLVRSPFSARPVEVDAGSGTGFLWDDQGHVVTNFHVVDGARSLQVTLSDQSVWPAEVVGAEPRKDIAVLRIDAPAAQLTGIRLPSEEQELVVGQKALAIGNPFGLDHTLTVGVISALDREVQGYSGLTIRDMVQTDAAINPGNSGGPLLDSSGQLIGMNTLIYSQSGASAGIGFAVPVHTIQRMVPQIIRTGRAEQVGLGITLVSDRLARRAGIEGVVVDTVHPGSPAHRAGMRGIQQGRLGDVIVGIAGEEVSSYDDLYNALDGRTPGELVDVRLLRGGEPDSVSVELTKLR